MIVHVLGSMGAGGNERLCLELLRRCPPGMSQALITIDAVPSHDLEELFRAVPNVHFFHEPYARDARAHFVFRIARLLRRLRPRGVVIYAFGIHLLIAMATKVLRGVKIVVHAGNPPPPQGPGREMFRRIVQASRWLKVPIWSCSRSVHFQLWDLGVVMPVNSRPEPNGVDVDALRSAAERGRLSRTDRGPVLTMVARLDAIKDHDTLISAFEIVLKRHPAARLWIIGDGTRRSVLEGQVASRDMGGAVCFLGIQRNVSELLGSTDVFVFSTTPAEGFGIALAEAMAVGLPIVASDVPACREVLGDSSGLLVPPLDATALADGLLSLLGDRPRMRALGAAATKRARIHFDIAVCANHYYGYLLDRPSPHDDRPPDDLSLPPPDKLKSQIHQQDSVRPNRH